MIKTTALLFSWLLLTGLQFEAPSADADFKLTEIDSMIYSAVKRHVKPQKEIPNAVTDFGQAAKMLEGIVAWNSSDDHHLLKSIDFRNGGKYICEDYFGFTAYYPDDDILVLEGGHSSDVSFNLSTGEETETAGNPGYAVHSPSKANRLNASFGGQQCFSYFIQARIDGVYRMTIPLNEEFERQTALWLCTIDEAFWANDRSIYFKTMQEFGSGRWGHRYYFLSL